MGYWYEYSVSVGGWSFGFDIENKEATFYDSGDVKIHTSTWPQIGKAVAKPSIFADNVRRQLGNDVVIVQE